MRLSGDQFHWSAKIFMQQTQNSPIFIETPKQIKAFHWYDNKIDRWKLKANFLVSDVTDPYRKLIWIEQEKWKNNQLTPMELVELLTSTFRHEMMEQLGLNPHES